eukprot:5033375-Pyramimonas_sp.AAC.2
MKGKGILYTYRADQSDEGKGYTPTGRTGPSELAELKEEIYPARTQVQVSVVCESPCATEPPPLAPLVAAGPRRLGSPKRFGFPGDPC